MDRSRAPFQTQHALQASDLAAALNDSLKKVRIGPGDYAPELMAPQGPSTAGGVQAMQHLRLLPGQPGLPTLVVGHANHADGKAELRTFEYVDAVHRQRFQRPLSLDRAQYNAFVDTAKLIFGALHLQTTIAGPPSDVSTDPTPAGVREPRSPLVVVVALLLLLVLGATAWLIFSRGTLSR